MANDNKSYTYFGGSNQLARLPYETIDILQKLGLYGVENNEDGTLIIRSKYQEEHPDNGVNWDVPIARLDDLGSKLSSKVNFLQQGSSDVIHIPDDMKNNLPIIYRSTSDPQKIMIIMEKDHAISGVYYGIEFELVGNLAPSASGIYIKTNYIWISGSTGKVTRTTTSLNYRHQLQITAATDNKIFLTINSSYATAGDTWVRLLQVLFNGKLSVVGPGTFACSGYNAATGKIIVAIEAITKTNLRIYYNDGTTADVASADVSSITDNILTM